MAGCSILILLPLLMGLAAAMVLLWAALWVYVVYAVIVLILSVVAYVIASRKGLFARYRDGVGWKHYATLAFMWFLRFEIAFYALTGTVAVVAGVLYQLRIANAG